MKLSNYLLMCVKLCEHIIENPHHKDRIEYNKGKRDAYLQVYKTVKGEYPYIMGNENKSLLVISDEVEK